jgi:lysozyme family protein
MSNYLKCLKKVNGKSTGIFAAGVLFGTAGIKVLASKDAKKLYTNCTAAILRAKSCVMKTATTIQENAEDIYAEAQQINEERAVAEEVVTDVEEADVEEADANETDVEESFKETETEEA